MKNHKTKTKTPQTYKTNIPKTQMNEKTKIKENSKRTTKEFNFLQLKKRKSP